MTRIAIVDYGMSNLSSVRHAFAHLGTEPEIVDAPAVLAGADGIVLPGDGAFGPTMENLRTRGWLAPLAAALDRGVPFLGICLGMQLLFDSSSENGEHRGLGLIRGRVEKFPEAAGKVPQIGWNELSLRPGARMFRGVADGAYAYFVHSYYCAAEMPEVVAAETEYGLRYASAVESGRVWGTQFHPEKSGEDGLNVLRNFVALVEDRPG